MSTTRRFATSLAIAAVAAAGVAANTANADQRLYAQCEGPEEKAHVAGVHATTQMTPDEPGSVESGNGCGQSDVWLAMNPDSTDDDVKSVSWNGTFDGDIETLTVIGWLMAPGPEHGGQSLTIPARIFIDGYSILPEADDALVVGQAFIEVTPRVSSTPGFSEVTFSVQGIDPTLGATGETHDIWVHLEHPGISPQPGGLPTYMTSTPQAWVWGVAEAPSGVNLNPSELADVVLDAPAPA